MNNEEIRDYIGEIVDARCEEVSDKRVVFKFDEVQWAFVPRGECPDDIKKGDVLALYVDGIAKNGMWACSIDKVQIEQLYRQISDAKRDNIDIQVEAIGIEENGLVCDVMGLAGFMPLREIEDSPHVVIDSYVGQTLKARILKFSPTDGTIIVSRRAAMADQLRESREKLLSQLKPDQVYEGTVKQIVDFGAFVDIGAGVEGLVHRSNLSWGNRDPAEVVSIGSKLKVIVLSVEEGRISLGHKQLIEDPWAAAAQKLTVGSIVDGKVTTFANFGAYVRVGDQIEGLVHNSELSWDNGVRNARQILKLGDDVKVKIIGIDEGKRRLSLSLKQVSGNPWEAVSQKYPVGSVQKLTIASIADFGLFVDLGDGLRGLIHKNDLQWNSVNIDLNATYHVGDEIECKVLGIDIEKCRASLGVKQLSSDPWADFIAQKPLGKQFEATIRKTARIGAFASIGEVSGLIHISELSEVRVPSVESVVHVGQTVQVTVIGIDEERRRINLSLIAEPFDPEASSEIPAEPDEAKPTIADIIPDELKPKL